MEISVSHELVIGREEQGAGNLRGDQEISRRHARVSINEAGVLLVEDLGSTNGTFGNDRRVASGRVLRAGDSVRVGATTIEVVVDERADPEATRPQQVPPIGPGTPVAAPPTGPFAQPRADQRRPRSKLPILAAGLFGALLLLALGYIIGHANGGSSSSPTAGAPASVDANSSASGWIYINANNAPPNQNAVVAIPYGPNGSPAPGRARSFLTGGTGTPLVLPLPNSVGTTAGDHQVLLSANNKLLFAVNQGSNSIAIFHVNGHTGALTPVEGSPFFSGGMAPVGLGFAGNALVVADHGIIAPFNPLGSSPPGPSDLVSFQVSASGTLAQVSSTAPDPDGLIDATVSPRGNEIVTSGFYPEIVPHATFPTFGPQLIRSVELSGAGALTQAQAFPIPASFTEGLHLPSFIPPALYRLPFGVAVNPDPTKPYVYVAATVAGKIAVYNYSNRADLTLTSSVHNLAPGGGPTAACWFATSKNGQFLYSSDSVSQSLTTFAISSNGSTLTNLGLTPLKSMGTSDALAFDPTGRWLYIIGNHDDPDSPRPEGIKGPEVKPAPLNANYLDAYSVNESTGQPTEIATVKIPVATADLPYGVATLKKS